MRTAFLSFLVVTSLGWSTEVGHPYQQVIADRGEPASRMDAGSTKILRYNDASIKFKDGVVVSVTPVTSAPAPAPAAKPAAAESHARGEEGSGRRPEIAASAEKKNEQPLHLQLATLRRARAEAEERVKAIVNQPVTPVEKTARMRAKSYGDAWFHDGATVPAYNTVDIRMTQELPYAASAYVSSDLNPGVAFVGSDLEFNPMTKYYYTDKTLPKKKLTGPEMEEVNRLYRAIGLCDQKLKELTSAKVTASR